MLVIRRPDLKKQKYLFTSAIWQLKNFSSKKFSYKIFHMYVKECICMSPSDFLMILYLLPLSVPTILLTIKKERRNIFLGRQY